MANLQPQQLPLTVLYDGACGICRRTMEHYKRLDQSDHLRPVDIASPDFHPETYQLTRKDLEHSIHAVTADGQVYTSEQAFRMIWRALPPRFPYGWLDRMLGTPGLRYLAHQAYRLFSRYRYQFSGECLVHCRRPGG